jgi:hypothetical protein
VYFAARGTLFVSIDRIRTRTTKENSVRTQTSLIAAAATLALVIPAVAGAAPDAASRLHGALRGSKPKAHNHRSLASDSRSARGADPGTAASVIYIVVPAATGMTATPYVDPNECADSGNGCTNLQFCQVWGENCGSLTAADLATAATAAPVAGTTPPPDATQNAALDRATAGSASSVSDLDAQNPADCCDAPLS